MKTILETNRQLAALPNAADMWLAVIIVLAAFDKPIRWYVWTLFGLEILAMLVWATVQKLLEKS